MSTPSRVPTDEAVLADALRRGEGGALSALVEGYSSRIFGFASRMCRSAEDAQDVVQETFLAAIRSLKDFRGEGEERIRALLHPGHQAS